MATATLKKGRSKVVQKSAVEQISALLQELPKKEKQELPLAEAIAGMAGTIQSALAKGYSYDELSKMLSEQLGVLVSVWSLRRYLNTAIQGTSGSKTVTKGKRGRKAKAKVPVGLSPAAVSQSIEELTIGVAVVDAVAPEVVDVIGSDSSKKRRTRTSSKGKAAVDVVAEPAQKRVTRTKTAAAKADDGVKTTPRKPRTTALKTKAGASRGGKKTS